MLPSRYGRGLHVALPAWRSFLETSPSLGTKGINYAFGTDLKNKVPLATSEMALKHLERRTRAGARAR